MELSGFVPLVKRWWLLLALSALVAGGTAYALASRLTPTYEAEVALLTGPINTDYGTLRASGELARTYSELATKGPLLEGSANAAGVDARGPELKESVSATANEVTRIVTIRVRDSDPRRAARFANALADRLAQLTRRVSEEDLETIDELMDQREIDALPESVQDRVRAAVTRVLGQPTAGRLQVVDEATAPTEPVAPPVSLMTVLAAMAGILAAGVFALVKESSADAISSEDDLAEVADAPVLGRVDGLPRRGGARRDGLVVEARPESGAANSYRVLAAKIGLSDEDEGLRSLLVVGTGGGDGSGLLAANLAAALAEGDTRVTLVDANTLEADITRSLDLADRPGYADVVRGSDGREPNGFGLDGVRVRRSDELDIVPRGNGGDPGALETERARQLLDRLMSDVAFVVVNAPPVQHSATALVWARVADATLLVARQGKSKRNDVTDSVKSLSIVGANLIGTVLREGPRIRLRRR